MITAIANRRMFRLAVSIWTIAVVLLPTIVLASCGPKTEPTPTAAQQARAILENMTWLLQSYGQPEKPKAVIKGTEITMMLDAGKGQVAGFTGVNSYSGGYVVEGFGLSFPKPLVATEMAGPQPLMDQETEFLSLLQAAESFKIEGDTLTIKCGSKVLVFTK